MAMTAEELEAKLLELEAALSAKANHEEPEEEEEEPASDPAEELRLLRAENEALKAAARRAENTVTRPANKSGEKSAKELAEEKLKNFIAFGG